MASRSICAIVASTALLMAGMCANTFAGGDANARSSADHAVVISVDQRNDSAVSTSAIQGAIDQCAANGGGRTTIPAGEYQVKPLSLRDNAELHLERGAILHFSQKFDDYPMIWVDDGSGKEPGTQSPIYGERLSHIAITGEGVIDGGGDAWRMVKRAKRTDAQWDALLNGGGVTNDKRTEWYPSAMIRDGRSQVDKALAANGTSSLEPYVQFRPLLRPNLVRLVNCKDVRLEGVTLSNSASWNVHLAMCDDVNVKNVTIFNDISAQNGDGIDIDSCRNVTMTGSKVDAGDDAICLKSGKDAYGRGRNRPTENVMISGCTIGTGHGGIVIGSEMSGGVRNVTVTDCTLNGTDNGLRFKSTRGRGGVVENINISHIKMSKIAGVAILFDLFYGTKGDGQAVDAPANEATPQFRNFHLSDITCDVAGQALQLRGLPEMMLKDMTLENVSISADRPGMVAHADGIIFKNVQIKAENSEKVRIAGSARIRLDQSSGFEN